MERSWVHWKAGSLKTTVLCIHPLSLWNIVKFQEAIKHTVWLICFLPMFYSRWPVKRETYTLLACISEWTTYVSITFAKRLPPAVLVMKASMFPCRTLCWGISSNPNVIIWNEPRGIQLRCFILSNAYDVSMAFERDSDQISLNPSINSVYTLLCVVVL